MILDSFYKYDYYKYSYSGQRESIVGMEGNQEYFIIEDLGTIKGYCNEFISK